MGRDSGAGGGGGGRSRAGHATATFSVRQQHLGNVRLKLKVSTEGALTKVTVTRRLFGEDRAVATSELGHRNAKDLYPQHVVVDSSFRRLGIASRMYAAAENATGRSLVPSKDQTPEGRAFSAAFRGKRKK